MFTIILTLLLDKYFTKMLTETSWLELWLKTGSCASLIFVKRSKA